jgi:hypothetical protein
MMMTPEGIGLGRPDQHRQRENSADAELGNQRADHACDSRVAKQMG